MDAAVRFLDAIQALQDQPVEFVRKFFKVEPEPFQADVMNAVARGDRGVSVKSAPGVGKTTLLSWTAIWWITVYHSAKVAVTAPSSGQINDAFLPEIKQWLGEMPDEVQKLYNVKADRIEFAPFPHLNFVSVKTARAENPDSLAGVHAKHVLLIGDEAPGIPEPAYERASASSMANPHACMLLTGNPVRNTGYFYDTFTRLSEQWTNFTVTAFDSDRLTDTYIEEARILYGEDSNGYRIRILAEFPRGDDDTVVPIYLIDGALARDVHPSGGHLWGLDIARFGDNKTALCKRRVNCMIQPIIRWAGLDTMEVVGRVQQEWDVTPSDKRPIDILVDSTGVGGGVADRLRQIGLPARDINVGESPAMKKNYVNLRSELWYKAREWLEGLDVALIDDDEGTLRRELSALRYGFTPSNKIRVETKDEVRKRGVASPDAADSLVLTFAGNAILARHGRKFDRGKPIKRNLKGIV